MRMVPANGADLLRDAKSRVARAPDDAAALIALSNACATLADIDGMVAAARRAVDLAPDDPDVVLQMAQSLLHTGSGIGEAQTLYERLLTLAPENAVGLHHSFTYAMLDGRYREAIEHAETLERLHPNDASRMAGMARALKLLGDDAAACAGYRLAADLCADAATPFPHGRSASLRPVYTALAGDQSGAERLSAQICTDGDVGLADPDHPRYPPDWRDGVARARTRTRGRDLYVFGNGPSLAEIAGRPQAVAPFDFLSMTMSSFQLPEDDVLRPIGRSADFVCITHPAMLRDQSRALRDLIARSPEAALVLPIWLRELWEARGEANPLLDGPVLWFDCYGQHPAHPGEPLHVPSVNTLLCALCTALLLEPRRIFLFGFDGRIKGEDSQAAEALYYKEHDPSYLKTARKNAAARELTRKWLWWDSLQFSEVAPHALRHTALLFDLDLPPIYNVCPGSALTPFPRVTFDQFLDIARDGKAAA